MPAVDRIAALPLDFLVIGGGIGGLAVAYVLSKSGHRVRVLEKRDLNVPGGGHRVPPNLSKILRHWVGEEELRKVSTRCVGTPFHHLRTGNLVGYLHWKPAVMAETGGEFLMMHHDDIVRMLYRLATEAGAQIDFHTEVTSIQQGTDRFPNPSVTLANGDVLTADMIIGADGYRSKVREVVLEEEDVAKPGGMTLYTGVVKAEDMLKDPELRPYALSDEWPIWMGPHRSVCGHPVRAKKEFFFHVYSWNGLDGQEQAGEESWEELFPTEKLNLDGHGPKVQRLIKMTPHLIRTRFMTRPGGIDDWVDSTGRIVLLGDAAHPSFPGGSHPAAMAVEDAVVLGSLFSHLRTLDQIPSFTSAYQELRERRCELVKLADIANAQMVAMPDGPHAQARDEDMRRRKDEWDEGTLKAQFEEIAEIFLYDAGDAAEEWWVNWGRFSEIAREQPHVVDFSNFTTVTVSEE
ncbi:FAD/NAD-P-binding domain-containing protein [Cubamyces sp. BRFM 1775]|nr:FAD/NAD-P-binding domain-containing protein [Cubamyces sp. BRFM 1775]